jgi:hypothetical protein
MQYGGTRKTRFTKQQLINKSIGEMRSLLDQLARAKERKREHCLETLHCQSNSCSTIDFSWLR